MTLPQQSKPRRPRSWAALAAILMIVITTLVAIRAWQAMPGSQDGPQNPVRVVVEGEPGYGITQQRVDELLKREPIMAWEPLTVVVTDQYLSGDETLRGEVAANTVRTSSQMDNMETDADSQNTYRFRGTGFDRQLVNTDDEYLEKRFDLDGTFRDNVAVGHGPAAVQALARASADLLADRPTSAPLYWFAAVGLCAMLTAVCLAAAGRYRARWESRHRRLTAAQRKLARVVLDLEALEATYAAAPADRRPSNFQQTWDRLETLSLQLARREGPMIAALSAKATALTASTGQQLTEFETDARQLISMADALMGAGSVHARLAGTGSTFDQLSQPINDAAVELLIRLERAPGRMVPHQLTEQLRAHLGDLLQAAAEPAQQSTAVQRWDAAERQIGRTAKRLFTRLRRFPHTSLPELPTIPEDHLRLLSNLGLTRTERDSALHQLYRANAMTRAILGDTLDSDAVRPRRDSANRSRRRVLPTTGRGADEPRARHRILLAVLCTALLGASMIAAGIVVSAQDNKPTRTHEGSGQGMTLRIDDAAGLVDEQEIRNYLHEDFITEQQVTVAVRDAEAYLEFEQRVSGSEYRDATASSVRQTLWRIKEEFSELADPDTTEFPAGTAIIPLLITDAGDGIVPGMLTGEVFGPMYNWDVSGGWEYGSIYESSYPAMEASNMLESYATALARNRYTAPDYSATALFWILTLLFFFTTLNVVQVVHYGLGASARLGRLGRGRAQLRQTQRKLEELAMGLDEAQINAVAVLGAAGSGRADEAGQRLFERALVMAWREAEELAALPLSERLGAGYAARVHHLATLVASLGERDADVARRARELIRVTRGAGGEPPAPVSLPGVRA